MRSNLAPNNEKGEFIFSPLANFVVEAVGTREANPKQRLIKLKEVGGEYLDRTPLYY